MKIRNCNMCGVDISHLYRTAHFCSAECYDKHLQIKKDEKLKEDIKESHEVHTDPYKYIECGICGFRGGDITSHILKIHKMKTDEYKKTYNVTTTLSQERKDALSERMKGDKNPGYNHGGRLSPFSKNFVGYDEVEDKEEVIEDLKKKAVVTKIENNNNPLTTDYYTSRGYSLEKAKELVYERQSTFSLEKCIEKHGENEGVKVWEARQEKWQNTLSNKSIEEIREINKKKGNNGNSSIAAIKFFNNLVKELSYYDIKKQDCIFNDGEKQFTEKYLLKDDNQTFYFYDFCHEPSKLIIEFHGKRFHPKLNKNNWSKIKTNKSLHHLSKEEQSQIIYEKDQNKIALAQSNGYHIEVIWDDELPDIEEYANKLYNLISKRI